MKRPLILLTGLVISFLVVWSAYRIERDRARGVSAQSGMGGGAQSTSGGQGSVSMSDGALKVEMAGTQLFQDTFSYGLDVTNKWTCTNGGGGSAATSATGATILSSGTTANGFSKCVTQATFIPTEPGFVQAISRINIESPILTSGYRFWGLGTSPASPTIAAPMSNGVGLEIGTDGHLDCVTYATGNRTLIKDLTTSGMSITDNKSHSYIVRFRGDTATYYVDMVNPSTGAIQPVPSCGWYSGASGPDVNELPFLIEAVSNGTPAVTVQNNATIISDTGRNSTYISDSTYPWRKAQVCDKTGFVSGLGSATVLLISPPPQGVNPSAIIKLCSISFSNTNITASNIKLVEGTGATCGTNQTQLTGNFAIPASGNFSPVIPLLGAFRTNVSGDALCATGSALGAVDITFTYYQGP